MNEDNEKGGRHCLFCKATKGATQLTSEFEYETIRRMNPIVLAYIGDATYEQKVRLEMIRRYPNQKIHELHKKAVSFAKAKSQADIVHALRAAELLSEEEWYFVKRGRNTQSMPPKNADVNDYRYATGFEAMIGYLFLSGREDRLERILHFAFERILGARSADGSEQ